MMQTLSRIQRGFDTRDTEYSGARLAWESVSWTLQQGNRVALPPRRQKRSWADDLLNAFGQVPCYESPIIGRH
ncbi:unnamed protein product [Enterobius vermicularis]|uniref:Transposase n=1 Tax=Enterobius vermicularis TaxID=51028 RepID=A0A0N4VIE9_ENTVE|nr:unnamed protein product [Enterobius vermicularis]